MTRLVFNRDGGSADEYGHLLALSRFMSGEVIQGFNVQANSSPNMTTKVQPGTARIPTGTSPSDYAYFVGIDTSGGESVTHTTADASNPRYDLVVAYVDKGVTASSSTPNNPNNMLKLAVVAGTPNASPVEPNSAAIQSAVGAANPYIILARVLVGTGVTQVTTSNITDRRTLVSPVRIAADPTIFDHVSSGCVWSGDSYGSTRNASMTAGVVYINGRPVVVSAVSGRGFTASKDTYVDVLDNGDGTGSLVYTEVSPNTSSPALAANSVRIAIIVTGASNIANVGSVNQGQEDKVLPIVSSVPYAVTDSLGNLICSRDPKRLVLGYRQILSNVSGVGNNAQLGALSCPVIIPPNRKVEIEVFGQNIVGSTANGEYGAAIWDGVVGSGTQLAAGSDTAHTNNAFVPFHARKEYTPNSTSLPASKTYNAGSYVTTGTATYAAGATNPAYIKVKLA